MELEQLSFAQDEEMVHTARYHWLQVGTVVNHQRDLGLLSRVFSGLRKPAEAKRCAERCVLLTEENPAAMQGFIGHLRMKRWYARSHG